MTIAAVLECRDVRIVFPDVNARRGQGWATLVKQAQELLRQEIDAGRCGGVSIALHPQDERCDHEVQL